MKRILANNNKKSPVNINEIELEVEVNNKNKKNLGENCIPNVDGYNEMDKNKGAAKDLVRKGLDKIKKSYGDNEAALRKGALSNKKEFDNTGRFKGDVVNGVPFEKPKEGEKGWIGKGIDRIKKAHKKKPYQERILEGAKKHLIDTPIEEIKKPLRDIKRGADSVSDKVKKDKEEVNKRMGKKSYHKDNFDDLP